MFFCTGQCEGVGRRRKRPRRAKAGSMLAEEGPARGWGVGGVEVLSFSALLPVPPKPGDFSEELGSV